MNEPRVTLDQWHLFQTVVAQGSFQGAADHLIKSQSSVSYGIQKMQDSLGVRLFEQRGRRSVLTQIGKSMLKSADALLAQAANVEKLAVDYSEGWEPLLRIMSSQIFPPELIVQTLGQFAETCPVTSVDFQQGTLSGVTDAATFGTADLIFTSQIPIGFAAQRLMTIQMARVVHHLHPLASQPSQLSTEDLKQYPQVVIGDTGSRRRVDAGWLGSDQRWTVSSIGESQSIIEAGLGHGNLPVDRIQDQLSDGSLVELQVQDRQRFEMQLYLVYANKQALGPAGHLFSKLLLQNVRRN